MIVAFYSYKGGVGRSMAMANLAVLFARAGFRVLTVDFDLEAPGLESYLCQRADTDPQQTLSRLRDHPGLIDLIYDYMKGLTLEGDSTTNIFPNLDSYLCTPEGEHATHPLELGTLTLLTAGRRDPQSNGAEYTHKVNNLSWSSLYRDWAGAAFIEWLRQELLKRADLVFIDTRTGLTEVGGVCTHEMADLVVALCGSNQQSLVGTQQVIASLLRPEIKATRSTDGEQERPLDVLPLLSRLEMGSGDSSLNSFIRDFDAAFESVVSTRIRIDGRLSALSIPYTTLHARPERLAVPNLRKLGEEDTSNPPGIDLLIRAYYRLADALVSWWIERLPVRTESQDSGSSDVRFFIDCSPEDADWGALLQTALEADEQGAVSLGLLDVDVRNRPGNPVRAMEILRDIHDPPQAKQPCLMIRLIDPERDVPEPRWTPAAEIRRCTWPDSHLSAPLFTVEIRSSAPPHSNPRHRRIHWSEQKQVAEVVKSLTSKINELPNSLKAVDFQHSAPQASHSLSQLTVEQRLDKIKTEQLDWKNTTGSARKWWNAFEEENATRTAVVLQTAEELAARNATITEFFLSYVYSNTDNIRANLHYLDYSRLKKEEDRKKKLLAHSTSASLRSASEQVKPVPPPTQTTNTPTPEISNPGPNSVSSDSRSNASE